MQRRGLDVLAVDSNPTTGVVARGADEAGGKLIDGKQKGKRGGGGGVGGGGVGGGGEVGPARYCSPHHRMAFNSQKKV